jgi:hypothetical protein
MQAAWECHLLEENLDEMLADPRQIAIVTEIESHDGSDRDWVLPFTHVTIRFTRRGEAQRVG